MSRTKESNELYLEEKSIDHGSMEEISLDFQRRLGRTPMRAERLSPRREQEMLARESKTIQDYDERKAWRSARLNMVKNQWVESRTKKRSDDAEQRRNFVNMFCCCMG